jgi:hypothetical protein
VVEDQPDNRQIIRDMLAPRRWRPSQDTPKPEG